MSFLRKGKSMDQRQMNSAQTEWLTEHLGQDKQGHFELRFYRNGLRLEARFPEPQWFREEELAAIRELQEDIERVVESWRARVSCYVETTHVLSPLGIESGDPPREPGEQLAAMLRFSG